MSLVTRRDVLKQGAASLLIPSLVGWSTRASAKDPEYGTDIMYADAVFVDGAPKLPAKGSFCVAVLPDTQHYSETYPETFMAQTQWIAENAKDRNITAVLHLGDITNHSTVREWENAQRAMNVLDDVVPYFIVHGNHDLERDGKLCQDRNTRYNEYFPVDKFKGTPTFGGVYDKQPDRHENSYHLFSAGGRDYVVISLEYGPRNDVLRWAGEVADKHADRAAILTTHAYMYFDETRYDWSKYGIKQAWNPHNSAMATATNDDVNDGEQIWQKLIKPRKNFILTLNGHVLKDGLAHITDKDAAGRDVHQVLVNYQMKPNGGDGWLRLLEFSADGKSISTCDYSPVLNRQNESKQNKFTLRLS